jgi:hypothetical protein
MAGIGVGADQADDLDLDAGLSWTSRTAVSMMLSPASCPPPGRAQRSLSILWMSSSRP